MKKIKYILIGVVFSLSMGSCNDVLDKSPDGGMTLKEAFSTPDNVSAFLNSCYNNIPQKGFSYWFFDSLLSALSDDSYSSEDQQGQHVQTMYDGTNASAGYHPIRDSHNGHGGNNGNIWPNFYAQIRLCNQFLENIDGATVRSESERSRLKAEAYVLRAFFYSELIKWFGDVPIIDKTYPLDYDFATLRRSSVYDVAKFIEADCDAALSSADLPWRITSYDEAPRMTKAVAWTLKSKMLLFAASPLFNKGVDYWEEAYQSNKAAVTALKANGYALYTTPVKTGIYGNDPWSAYHELAGESTDYSPTPKDKETIYQHRQGATFACHVGWLGAGENMYKCGACPTQELVDAFETIDGVPVLDLNNPYTDEKHLTPNYNSANTTYDPANPYANRDPRFYATVAYNGSAFEIAGIPTTIDIYNGGRFGIDPAPAVERRKHTLTGYYHTKLLVPATSGGSGNGPDNSPWKFFRLAEVLLNYAEAAAEAGHLAEAKAAADEVRDRVGMPALPGGLSKADLITRIRNERRIELSFEECRYFDLRRWQTPTGDLSATCKWFTAMYITKNPDSSFSYQRKQVRSEQRYGYENKDLLLPINLDESSKMEFITGVKWQNPGW